MGLGDLENAPGVKIGQGAHLLLPVHLGCRFADLALHLREEVLHEFLDVPSKFFSLGACVLLRTLAYHAVEHAPSGQQAGYINIDAHGAYQLALFVLDERGRGANGTPVLSRGVVFRVFLFLVAN